MKNSLLANSGILTCLLICTIPVIKNKIKKRLTDWTCWSWNAFAWIYHLNAAFYVKLLPKCHIIYEESFQENSELWNLNASHCLWNLSQHFCFYNACFYPSELLSKSFWFLEVSAWFNECDVIKSSNSSDLSEMCVFLLMPGKKNSFLSHSLWSKTHQ